MKLKRIALAVGAVLFAGAASAEFSANIGVTSNYVWRGVTQTGNDAAISGGLDYAHDSGFYAGTWASNVDFGNEDGTSDGGAEVDLYVGFGGEFGDGIGYDVGLAHYMYPHLSDSDFTELYGSLSYSYFTGGIHYTVHSDVDDTSAENELFIEGDLYFYVGASYEVMPTWTLGGTIGYYDFDDDGVDNTDTSYMHYQIDIGKSAGDLGDFTFSFSKAEEESGDDDWLVFASWSKSFE
jgi:uncharacterized protein (TIGR02001 family)